MSTSMVEGSPLKLMLRFAMPLLAGNRNERTPVLLPIAGAERVPRSPVILHSCSEWLLHGFAESDWNSSHAAK